MLRKNDTITIAAVANGFKVSKALYERGLVSYDHEQLVFESFESMDQYLRKHFDEAKHAEAES